jgi:hypothetical protein
MSVRPAMGQRGRDNQSFDVVEVGQVGEAGNGGRLSVAIEDGTLEADRKGGLDMRGPVIDEQHRPWGQTHAGCGDREQLRVVLEASLLGGDDEGVNSGRSPAAG